MSIKATSHVSEPVRMHQTIDIGPNYTMPEENMVGIFTNLSLSTLGLISSVCKTWQRIAGDESIWKQFHLSSLFSNLITIGPVEWDRHVDLKKYGLDVTGSAQNGGRDNIRALKLLLETAQIEGNAGFTKLTLPKGLTFNILTMIAKEPKEGLPTGFNDLWRPLVQKIGDVAIPETVEVVLSNSILKGSRKLKTEGLKVLVAQLGCALPQILAAATLAILTKIMKGVRLFGDETGVEKHHTFTRCSPQGDVPSLVLGDYDGESGPDIMNDPYPHKYYGAAIQHTFKPLNS